MHSQLLADFYFLEVVTMQDLKNVAPSAVNPSTETGNQGGGLIRGKMTMIETETGRFSKGHYLDLLNNTATICARIEALKDAETDLPSVVDNQKQLIEKARLFEKMGIPELAEITNKAAHNLIFIEDLEDALEEEAKFIGETLTIFNSEA
jgi:hypothetical protein